MAERDLRGLRHGLQPHPAQVQRVLRRARRAHRRRLALRLGLPGLVLLAAASLLTVRPLAVGPGDGPPERGGESLVELDLWPPTCELPDSEPLECPT